MAHLYVHIDIHTHICIIKVSLVIICKCYHTPSYTCCVHVAITLILSCEVNDKPDKKSTLLQQASRCRHSIVSAGVALTTSCIAPGWEWYLFPRNQWKVKTSQGPSYTDFITLLPPSTHIKKTNWLYKAQYICGETETRHVFLWL